VTHITVLVPGPLHDHALRRIGEVFDLRCEASVIVHK